MTCAPCLVRRPCCASCAMALRGVIIWRRGRAIESNPLIWTTGWRSYAACLVASARAHRESKNRLFFVPSLPFLIHRMRADFSTKTKDVLGKRVGFQCSNPTCGVSTVGPHSSASRMTSIGVAAHIVAASVGGPRFDANIGDEARAGIENGIWLCQFCAKLIDSDIEKYSVEVLRHWKQGAEKLAGERLTSQVVAGRAGQELKGEVVSIGTGYYEKQMPGYTIKYFLEGDLLHVEQELENGSIGYYVIDKNGNMVEHKLPYPMGDYIVEIDPALILGRREDALGAGLIRETVQMKWGKRAVLTWDSQHTLIDYHFENGARIDNVRKALIVESPQFESSIK